MEDERVLDISWGTLLKIATVFLGFYILYSIKDILLWILFGLIISILFNPLISFLERRRVPRVIGTLFVYVGIFAIFSLILYAIIPVLIRETQQFTHLFPQYFEKLAPPLRGLRIEAFDSFETFTQALQDWLVRASSSIFGAVISFFGGIFSTVTIFAMAIFFSIEEKEVRRAMDLLAPRGKESYFLNLWERCQQRTAAWFGARALSSLFVGLITFIMLNIFGMEYAAVLGLFAGLMDIIPVLGPIFSGGIIILLTALNYPAKAFLILVALVLIQQIEGNIITPILTKKMVGLPAILVLIALLVGGRLWGVLGAILAIPLVGVIYEFLKDFLKQRKKEETTAT